MKKFMLLALSGAMLLINASMVMATSPTPPVVLVHDFTRVSFEDGEATKWNVGGINATHELVSQGAVDGTKAVKVNMNGRTDDWGKITTLTITPTNGPTWNIATTDKIKATFTNPNAYDLSIRINLLDTAGNSRLTFFTIPANSSREITITGAYFGTPGVADSKWEADGYAQKGLDTTCIKEIRFHFPEPEPKFLPGITNTSVIMDNFYIEKGAAPAVVIEGSNFPVTSFEDGEAGGWSVTGATATKEIVTEGVVDGSKALKIALTERSMDWGKRTNFSVIPSGQVWNMGTASSIVATITNPIDAAIQLRCNLTDTSGNTRMTYFSIPAHSTREIVIGPEQLGTVGVKNESWKGDGYSGPGVDKSAIKGMLLYMAEPELTTMPGVTHPVYIIDNITIR